MAGAIFATRSFRTVRSTDPESREGTTHIGMEDRGFWIPGLARSARQPGMTDS